MSINGKITWWTLVYIDDKELQKGVEKEDSPWWNVSCLCFPSKIFLCAVVISHFDYCKFLLVLLFWLAYTSAVFPFFGEIRMALINWSFSPVANDFILVSVVACSPPLDLFQAFSPQSGTSQVHVQSLFLFTHLALHSCSLYPFGICLLSTIL